MKTTRILLIEDDHEDFLITRDLIRDIKGEWRYDIDWVSTYDEAKKALENKNHDVCLIDYNLGANSGLELVKEMYDSTSPMPFIFLTGQADYEIDRQVMNAGATDFLVKGKVTPGEMERTIRYGIRHIKNLHEIRSLNFGLEKRVEERTAELEQTVKALEESNKTLNEAIREKEQAQKFAQEALEKEKMLNELKSRFITMASHEFRTPLSTILSSVQLLAHHVGNTAESKTEKHFRRIRSNVSLLTDLLNDFLSLEKLEAGKIISSPEDFNFQNLVTEIVQEMQDTAKIGQEILLTHHDEKGPKEVLLDKRHVKGILINLISNAVKYSGENSTIEVKSFNYPNRQVVHVTDQGIGIPNEEQCHLFELFFRARNAINIKGTGLGLNIVKKYLDLMGGQIEFKSQHGVGTTFIVTLPNKPVVN